MDTQTRNKDAFLAYLGGQKDPECHFYEEFADAWIRVVNVGPEDMYLKDIENERKTLISNILYMKKTGNWPIVWRAVIWTLPLPTEYSRYIAKLKWYHAPFKVLVDICLPVLLKKRKSLLHDCIAEAFQTERWPVTEAEKCVVPMVISLLHVFNAFFNMRHWCIMSFDSWCVWAAKLGRDLFHPFMHTTFSTEFPQLYLNTNYLSRFFEELISFDDYRNVSKMQVFLLSEAVAASFQRETKESLARLQITKDAKFSDGFLTFFGSSLKPFQEWDRKIYVSRMEAVTVSPRLWRALSRMRAQGIMFHPLIMDYTEKKVCVGCAEDILKKPFWTSVEDLVMDEDFIMSNVAKSYEEEDGKILLCNDSGDEEEAKDGESSDSDSDYTSESSSSSSCYSLGCSAADDSDSYAQSPRPVPSSKRQRV